MDRVRDRSRRHDALSSRRCAGFSAHRRSHRALSEDVVDASVLDEASAAFSRGGDGRGNRARTANGCATTTTSEASAAGCSPTIMGSDSFCRCGRMRRRDCCTSTFRDRCAPHVKVTGSLSCRRRPKPRSNRSRSRSPTGAAAIAAATLISLQRRSLRGDISGAFVSLRTITGPDAEFAAAIRRASHEGPDILLVTGPQTELPLHEAILASTGGRLVIVAVVAPDDCGRAAHPRRSKRPRSRRASAPRAGGLVPRRCRLSKPAANRRRPNADSGHHSRIERGSAAARGRGLRGLADSQRQGSGGMRSVDEALARAIRRGQVSLREAAAHAIDRRHMVAQVRMLARTRLSRKASASGGREIHMPIVGG